MSSYLHMPMMHTQQSGPPPPHARKSGLVLIQSLQQSWPANKSNNNNSISVQSDDERLNVMMSTEQGNVNSEQVETFLDDHSDFLENYVRRKVSRSLLEKWLFKPNKSLTSSASSSMLTRTSSTAPGTSGQFCHHHHTAKPGSFLVGQLQRQRSRSFTPLRKLSATKFEESGLSTPILIKDVDGQPSFLRTAPKATSSVPSLVSDSSQHKLQMPNGKSDSNESRSSLFIHLLEKMFLERDVPSLTQTLGEGLISLHDGLDQISILILSELSSKGVINGDLYVVDESTGCTKYPRFSVDSLMTAVLRSRQPFFHPNTDNPSNEQCVAIAPVINTQSGKVIGCVKASTAKSSVCFTKEDRALFTMVIRFMNIALTTLVSGNEMRLELSRSEVFLELAQTVFSEQSRIEPTIRTILSNFLTMIECERCQILLTSPEDPKIFRRVFDLQRSDLNDDGVVKDGVMFEGRFPINAEITCEVASSGRKINLHNYQPPLDQLEDHESKDNQKSLLCLPIHDANQGVLGVISLINKEGGEAFFTENDERFAEAFSLFCGMAIRNAAEFERTVVSEAKLQVAFDIMNYQASSSEEEMLELAHLRIPSASKLGIDRFEFSYIGMPDSETYVGQDRLYRAQFRPKTILSLSLPSVIRMFTDLGLLSHFNISYNTFCRWILTVKKNYRNETVPYHNWYHAFNVTQMMYCLLRKSNWDLHFSKTDCLGLMIACLNHDLDHRGTTNAFQIKSGNPLATLYSSSTMERHHLNQCLLLLNIPGNVILENVSEEEYSSVLSVIERCILATDLAHHFRVASKIHSLASSIKSSFKSLNLSEDPEHIEVVQWLLMTACDLAHVTKPWPVHLYVSKLVAEEFWAQGDLERAKFDETPPPMMDRHASLPEVQLDFIDNICTGVYRDLAALNHRSFDPLLQECLENRRKWEQGYENHEHHLDRQTDNDDHDRESVDDEYKERVGKGVVRNL